MENGQYWWKDECRQIQTGRLKKPTPECTQPHIGAMVILTAQFCSVMAILLNQVLAAISMVVIQLNKISDLGRFCNTTPGYQDANARRANY